MTPEERAATAMTFYRALVNRHGDRTAACEAILETTVAAAIREATETSTADIERAFAAGWAACRDEILKALAKAATT